MLVFLILGLIFISVFWKYKKLVVFGFCLLFLVFGIWRHQEIELGIMMKNELGKYNDLNQKITLVGTISAEPDIRDTSIKLTIKVSDIQTKIQAENSSPSAKGKILITANRYPEYQYGDKLKITGKLETPKVFEEFNYKNYLAKEEIYSVIYYPEIELLIKENYRSPTSIIYAKILGFKNKLKESIYQNLSPPQSSILGAMILGDKRRISEEWKEKLNIAGVRHITCVSGMHIVILSGILMWLGMALGLWRGQAFYFAIVLLALFIIMVGAPSSAIRAGIMGGLFLFAQKVGRLRSGGRAIIFAGTLMLFQNPLLLRFDIGFQLSFLAALGIIYLMPIFQHWFKKIPNFKFLPLGFLLSPVSSLLAMTFAAQIFTLPILIYNFGRISLVAPLSNILIVPFLPFIMVLGFIFGLMGMLWQPLGWVLSWPAWASLTYLIKIVDGFSKIPWASLTIENVHWIWLAISYLVLGYIIWRLNKKQKLKFLNYY